MGRPGIDTERAKQRELLAEVVHALRLDDGRSLENWLKDSYEQAQTDAERMRVIIDQVASLTDVSVVRWHDRLIR